MARTQPHPRHGAASLIVALAAGTAAAGAAATPVGVVPGGVATTTLSFASYDAVTTPVSGDGFDVGSAETGTPVRLNFSDPAAEHIVGAVPASFGGNGSWPAHGAYVGLNSTSGTLTFTFAEAMSFVGGYLNYKTNSYDGAISIAILDESGDVLEDEALQFNFADPSAVGLGLVRGFARDSADIWGFRLSNGYLAIDDLTFGRTTGNAVPEPGTLALLLAAAGAALVARRRA